MRKLAFALLAVSILSCTGRDGSTETNETTEEINVTEDSLTNDVVEDIIMPDITEELLWEIFMKIPEKDAAEDYDCIRTKKQRQKLKTDGEYSTGEDENAKNYLKIPYSASGEWGSCNATTFVACFPFKDGKKLLVLFIFGGGPDGLYTTKIDKTYEYELSTGVLTPIKRPIEPYTSDEFFVNSIFTPKQLKATKYMFKRGEYFELDFINNNELGVYLRIGEFFGNEGWEDWEEMVECESVLRKYSEAHGGLVRRYWNGTRFVKNLEGSSRN